MKREVNYVVRKCNERLFSVITMYQIVYHMVYLIDISLLNFLCENFAYVAA